MVINPFTSVAISKLLEMISRFTYVLGCSITNALHSDINQTAGSGGHLSVRKMMHACYSVSAACRPAEMGWGGGIIGSVHRSILVGRKRPNGRQRVIKHDRRNIVITLCRP